MERKLVWCAKMKAGIKLTVPDEHEARDYYERARKDLERLKKREIPEEWVPVVAYYSAYYAIYSLLRSLGIKSRLTGTDRESE